MSLRALSTALAVHFALSFSATASEFATSIVNVVTGPGSTPSFPPTNLLGGPQGGGTGSGSLHVCTLGAGGSVTLGFNVVIRNGPGADLIVGENGFVIGGGPSVFAEVFFVEVSTDGFHFARFPSRYHQPASGTPMGTYRGICGGMPILANVATNTIPPEDPVRAGGEAFDLEDLAADPFVTGGLLDLAHVNYVRVVDAKPGDVDSFGTAIVDSGNADADAVTVVQHAATASPNEPVCDLSIDGAGFLELRLGDANGFFNLDLAELRASINLAPIDFFALLSILQLQSYDGKIAVFRTAVPVDGFGVWAAFAVSVKDKQNAFSGDQVMVQG